MTGKHHDFFPIALGVFALVTLFGVVNDQVIATISPLQFTLNFPDLFPFANIHAKVLCFSLVVVGGPGLAWGILLYWAGHYGRGPVVGPRITVLGAAIVVLITVVAAWFMGWRVSNSGVPPYPMFFYPSEDRKIYISQTVQLTNYLVGFCGSLVWLAAIFGWRRWQADASAPKT